MTIRVKITCIQKPDRNDPSQRIQAIGGQNPDGKRWKLSLAQAIEGIEAKKYTFYVSQGGREVSVHIATSRAGSKYLKTEADDASRNNLLSLPQCP